MITTLLLQRKILMTTLTNSLRNVRSELDTYFKNHFQNEMGLPSEVLKAMSYSFIGKGKALRPFLVLTVADILNLDKQSALQIALAIEMVHTYSLIHDDLPAMDNDTLRRGQPTCHIQFSESTAILAGDALLTHAFEVLADEKTHPNALVRCQLIAYLAKSAGVEGMIGGQVMDLQGEKIPLMENEIYKMQSMKTGALLKFSCIAPAIAAQKNQETIEALTSYANAIGLLFQITDDLLDEIGSEQEVGKTLKKDKKAGKSTFLNIYGIQKTRELALEIHQKALQALNTPILKECTLLKELANFILTRTY